MGQYRFAIPDSDRFVADSLVAGQIIGLEGIPWPGKTVLNEHVLLISRNTDISGRLLVPWRTESYGELSLATGTLPEVDTAYVLELELARGSLSRLRNQVSIWNEGGLKVTDDFQTRLDTLVAEFSKAIFLKESTDQRMDLCEHVIDGCVDLMFEITDEFSRQIAAIHNAQSQNVPVIAGSVLEESPEIEAAVTRLAVQKMAQPQIVSSSDIDGDFDFTPTDPVIDWINDPAAASVRIAGPLVQFDNTELPGWMPQEAPFEQRMDAVRRMCRNLGAEYQKRIKILHVSSGISGVGHQHFNYPQQLQLTLEMLETLDQTMPNTSMMVSFDQPWGERLSMATGGVPAMEIADALLRYGARISAFGLEFNLDYWPQGSMMRDPLQWVDLIDRWSQFGLPLAIYLAAPTGDMELQSGSRFLQTIRGSTESNRHRKYLTTIFNLLVRRPAVNVVAWRRTGDSDNQRFPLSGLTDAEGQTKPVFTWFEEIVFDVISDPNVEDTSEF